jgi:addiction module HigA family antidote
MAQKRPIGGRPTHPGEILRADILPALGLTKVELAEKLGVSRQTLYQVLDEKRPISPNVALRVARLTGSRAGFWLDLQQAYDLAMAEAELGVDLERIPVLHTKAVAAALPEGARPKRKLTWS